MKVNVTDEMIFSTACSGGKGGQNVNKVETMVIARWNVSDSKLLTEEQKQLIREKLEKKITLEGYLLVKSQTARTQLSNKIEAIKKINELLQHAIEKKKTRISTKPTKASITQRVFSKKNKSEKKETRKKMNFKNIE